MIHFEFETAADASTAKYASCGTPLHRSYADRWSNLISVLHYRTFSTVVVLRNINDHPTPFTGKDLRFPGITNEWKQYSAGTAYLHDRLACRVIYKRRNFIDCYTSHRGWESYRQPSSWDRRKVYQQSLVSSSVMQYPIAKSFLCETAFVSLTNTMVEYLLSSRILGGQRSSSAANWPLLGPINRALSSLRSSIRLHLSPVS